MIVDSVEVKCDTEKDSDQSSVKFDRVQVIRDLKKLHTVLDATTENMILFILEGGLPHY